MAGVRKERMLSISELCQMKGETLHQYLVKYQIIPAEGTYTCPSCHTGSMVLLRTGNLVDEWLWDCPAKIAKQKKVTPCGKQFAYKMGTFFERSTLPINATLVAVLFWVGNLELRLLVKYVGMSERVALEWLSLCRDVIYYAMEQTCQPLGGPGITIEIDDAVYHCDRYHHGQEVGGQRVLGGYERGTGRVFLVPVERRNPETLVPLVMEWVLPGSIIISDIAALTHEDREYLTLNHAITFVDPPNRAHVNATEKRWRAVKAFYAQPGQLGKAHVPGNLARNMFYKRCRELKLDSTHEFYRLAGRVYDPRHSREEVSYPGHLAECTLVGAYVAEEALDLFDNLPF